MRVVVALSAQPSASDRPQQRKEAVQLAAAQESAAPATASPKEAFVPSQWSDE
jgi:hypothetical protein